MRITKTIIAFALIVIAAVAVSCSSGNDPRGVAENFLDAMREGNYEEAKNYATDDTHQQLDLLKDSPNLNEGKNFEIIDVSDKTDSTATVVYRWDEEAEKNLKMVKRDGDWKVKFNKMDEMNLDKMFEDMEMEMEEGGEMEMDTTATEDTVQTL